jgi:hypothetical protein
MQHLITTHGLPLMGEGSRFLQFLHKTLRSSIIKVIIISNSLPGLLRSFVCST